MISNLKKKIFIICVISLISLPTLSALSFNGLFSNEDQNLGLSADASSNQAQGVVDYFRKVFSYDWSLGQAYDPAVDGKGEAQSTTIYGSNYQPYDSEKISGTMKITPILSPDNSESQIISLINSATQTLYIEQMYIYNDLTELVNAIISAHDRGVEVRVILDDANNADSKASADLLTSHGISVKICTGTVPMYFDTMHNKGVIVDGAKVLISSINWSPTSIRENREAGLIIESSSVAGYYLTLYNHDWSVCVNYDPSVHLQTISTQTIQDEPTGNITPSVYINQFSTTQTFEGTMDVTCMASPDNCFNVVSNLLKKAKTNIYLSVYTLSSPYLIDIIKDRMADGVTVKLLLEKSQVGSYEQDYNRDAMYRLTEVGVKSQVNSEQVKAQGLWATQDFSFQHCKYCIIDNSTLILSSGNWGRSSCPKPQDDGDVDGNRDWWIAIYGSNPGDIEAGSNTFSIPFFTLDIWFLIAGLFTAVITILMARKLKVRRSDI